jgi:DNA (cytosine-5)-methyltransferase 1
LITEENIDDLFNKIDDLKQNNNVDLIIGGPPCQAYSVAGRAKQKKIANGENNSNKDDERKYLYRLYCKFLKYFRPKMFVFENVVGIISADGGKHWKDIIKLFDEVGYNIDYKNLNSKDFGVPQERKRIIIVGWLKATQFSYPVFRSIDPFWTLKDILGDLPSISAGELNLMY